MNSTSLTACGISFAYGRRTVLFDAEIQVRPGELSMLLGANGCGKSTLMKCLAGVHRPQHGRLLVGSTDLLRLSPRERATHTAYVPQSTAVDEAGISVHEIVSHGLPRGVDRAERRARVLDVLEQIDLLEHALDRVDHLSGGERQRVLIGRALVQHTPYLLLDEPVSALDLRHQVDILEILTGLAHDHGVGVLAIVHDINLAATYADSVFIMREGRVAAAGPPDEALCAELLEEVYHTPVSVHRHDGRVVVLPSRTKTSQYRAESTKGSP